MTYPPPYNEQPPQQPLPPQQPHYPPPVHHHTIIIHRPLAWYWHLLHITGTVFTCGLWGIVYAIHLAAHKKTRYRHH